MIHKAWSCIEEVPYCFWRSSIKYQGHTGWKIDDLNPVWVRLLGRSQLSNPSDLPCFTQIKIYVVQWKIYAVITLQGHRTFHIYRSKNIKVTQYETRQHSTQSVRNMPPSSPRHLLPHVLQIMPRNANYDQFPPKGHHNEENPQSMTKMPGNPKFYLFH